MASYSDLKIDSHYLIRDCYLGDNERLDVRVRVVAFCPESVCLGITFYEASTGRRRLFSKTPYNDISFEDYLHNHPLSRRSKHLRSNSRVVLFGCDTILEALLPLDTK